jgi:hypothetical protein
MHAVEREVEHDVMTALELFRLLKKRHPLNVQEFQALE